MQRGTSQETSGALLRAGVSFLERSGLGEARPGAEVLLADVLGISRARLYLEPETPVDPHAAGRFRAGLRRRAAGEPLQYITGTVLFCGRQFLARRGVFIPRPETEFLVEAALSRLRGLPGRPLVVDAGTGSGVIGLSLAAATPARLILLDRSARAVDLARCNRRELGLSPLRVRVVRSGFAAFARDFSGRCGMVVSNPPYIPRGQGPLLPRDVRREPAGALFGGRDGLSFIRFLVRGAGRILSPGGYLVFEVGAGQAASAASLARGSGYAVEGVVPDCAGIERVLVCRLEQES